jgi:hypothetical protein
VKIKLASIGVATALAVSTVFIGGSPAQAAPRSDACKAWACGSGTFAFTGRYTLDGSVSILDPLCNGSNAFIELRVHYFDGSSYTGKKRYDTTNNSACDSLYKVYNNVTFNSGGSKLVKSYSVIVGDSANGTKEGNQVDNPLT